MSEHDSPSSPVVPDKKWWQKPLVQDILSFVAIVVFVIIPFRIYIAQPYLVSGESMDPTFQNGEYLIVNELSYRFHAPARGDVIIFRYPKDPRETFIKRIIGLPGETVKLSQNGITIVNTEHPQGEHIDEPYIVFNRTDTLTLTLKSDEYFVMGDNRPASSDSRYWGPVPRANIIGTPILSLFPVSKAAVNPGSLASFATTSAR